MDKEKIKSAIKKTIRYMNGNYYSKFEEKIIDASSRGPFNINRDYMPLRALDNIQYLQQRKNISILMDGNAIIENESKNKLHDEFEVSKVNNAKIELPYLYY